MKGLGASVTFGPCLAGAHIEGDRLWKKMVSGFAGAMVLSLYQTQLQQVHGMTLVRHMHLGMGDGAEAVRSCNRSSHLWDSSALSQ